MECVELAAPEGGELRVIDFGGAGPDVLLVHHVGLSPLEWRSTVRALAGRVRAIAPAMRAHACSTAAPLPGTAGRRDIALVSRAFGLRRPVLVLAGWISAVLGLAAAVEEPDAYRALVTINGTLQPTRAQIEEEIEVIRSPQMVAYFRERFRLDSVVTTPEEIEELVRSKVTSIRTDWMVDESADLESEVRSGLREVPGGWSTSPGSAGILAPYEFAPDDPLFPDRSLYERLQVPLHIVTGTESWDYRSEALEFELERYDPPIDVTQVDGAGQFPMYSHPEVIAEIIVAACAGP